MLKYRLVLTARAVEEIQKTIYYYNSQQKGLGSRFYTDLKKQVSSIRHNPFCRAIRYDDIRFAMLDKFPYAAHYNIDGNSIIIQGVISTHQNPDTAWIDR